MNKFTDRMDSVPCAPLGAPKRLQQVPCLKKEIVEERARISAFESGDHMSAEMRAEEAARKRRNEQKEAMLRLTGVSYEDLELRVVAALGQLQGCSTTKEEVMRQMLSVQKLSSYYATTDIVTRELSSYATTDIVTQKPQPAPAEPCRMQPDGLFGLYSDYAARERERQRKAFFYAQEYKQAYGNAASAGQGFVTQKALQEDTVVVSSTPSAEVYIRGNTFFLANDSGAS